MKTFLNFKTVINARTTNAVPTTKIDNNKRKSTQARRNHADHSYSLA